MSKIYLVRVSYLVPVVAENEIEALQYCLEPEHGHDVLFNELAQVLDGLSDPEEADTAHAQNSSVLVEREVMAEDLSNPDLECWATVVPWGDEDHDNMESIEERLLGTEEMEEEY